ncbi:hypothetical protein [Paraburkholderia sp.]|uniref:hypothetical protein n=1 Tax=Paraburkholderia sp. TaxID=1926495 RepID=UPI0023A39053|nr:hypothetical protein [Paraburkholderia sp.]MDE1179364.1 hypothetical protein [Paraburkholderia sp.]
MPDHQYLGNSTHIDGPRGARLSSSEYSTVIDSAFFCGSGKNYIRATSQSPDLKIALTTLDNPANFSYVKRRRSRSLNEKTHAVLANGMRFAAKHRRDGASAR